MCKDCDENPVLVQQWRDQQDAWLRDTVRSHGWAIQYVFADDEKSPSLAYTVGLTGFDHPEFVVCGVDQASAAALLNALGERVRAGERMRDGEIVRVGAGRVMLFDLPNAAEVVLAANGCYGRGRTEPLPVLYAIYPDDRGAWPWEPQYDLPSWLQPMPGSFTG
jgi:hypothetical protein